MERFSLTHLTPGALHTGLKSSLARERDALADVLAHIAAIDVGQHYREAGYPSMHDYCVLGLHLSGNAAYKRIQAARAAREFPAIFQRVAEGALGLSVVNVLSPHLTAGNAEELLAAVSFKTREKVEELLAARSPQPAAPTTIEAIPQPMALASAEADGHPVPLAPGRVQEVAKPRLVPIATDLYKLQLTMSGAMYQKLRHARELLGHRKGIRDEAEVLELALDVLVAKLEKRRCAATDRPRRARSSANPRHVPAAVKREVWNRDDRRCTFVNEQGERCPARSGLECDHIVPVAKGGGSEPGNVRLRCRAHNQMEAERAYGKQFMQNKREQAKAAAAKRRAEKEARRSVEEALDSDELMPGLRRLGYTKEEARSALTKCGPMTGQPIEARLKRCLAVMLPPHRKVTADAALH